MLRCRPRLFDCKNFLLLSVSFLFDHPEAFGSIKSPPLDAVFKCNHLGAGAATVVFLKVIPLDGIIFLGKLFINIEIELLESHSLEP